ncbi:MAG: hypothetical protein NT028_09900, partial [candidate division Zixibacteria bacterium]|nr:hypothetical protein [candidate division Zixibacteria bacterium]
MSPTAARRLATKLIVALAAIACVLPSCAQLEFQGLGYNYLSETYVESLPKDSTRTYWLKLYRIMEIVNDTLSKRLQYLDIEEDSATIDSLVEEFKRQKDFETRPDTPDRNEWWEEIWNVRAAHCDSFYCTPLRYSYWDLRARPVIVFGLPEAEHLEDCRSCPPRFPTKCRTCSVTCQYYYMDWMGQNFFLKYADYGCYGNFDVIVNSDETIVRSSLRMSEELVSHAPRFKPYPEINKQIKAAIDIVSFPDGEDFTLWLSSGVGLSQYVTDSLQRVSFHQRVIIHRLEAKPTLIFSDSTPSMTLPLPDSVDDLDDYWFPLNFGGCRLPAGGYDVYLTLFDENAPNHLGTYRTTVTLPSPRASKGISEILVALQPAGRVFEGTDNRVVRGDYTLLANPAYHYRGDTIYPYVEIDLRDFKSSRPGTYDYTILASIYRAKETFGKPVTEIGDLFEISHDTVGNAPSKQFLRRPQQKGEALIYSTSRSTTNSKV